eukprot:maker-scaffold_1-snap-gene-9.14-mRNA-1 protein AED:0.07 eAED:0.07 QI:93/1/0.66/1/1/1/3/0/1086
MDEKINKETETSVKVAVRIRPHSQGKLNKRFINGISSNIVSVPERAKEFNFDFVFEHNSTQEQIYNSCVSPLVTNFFDGYNATILAYGQTGSGKTYTMGTSGDGLADTNLYGIVPRAMNTIFSLIEERRSRHPGAEFYLRVQFVELYGEKIIDLLDIDNHKVISVTSNNSDGKQNSPQGVSLVGASEVLVKSSEDMFAALEEGSLCRSTARTEMNNQSSRSHAIFSIILEQHLPFDKFKPSDEVLKGESEVNKESANEETQNQDEEIEFRTAKFHFVDLAGSERVNRTGASGQRFKEGVNINMGLLALGNVIAALSSQEVGSKVPVHVPYRSSKLTRILQDSLGGNSKTIMITCVSPAELDLDESVNAMRYAARARNIKNKPKVNRDPKSSQIAMLKKEIAMLRQKLSAGNCSETLNVCANDDFDFKFQLEEADAEIQRLQKKINIEKKERSNTQEKYLKLSAIIEEFRNVPEGLSLLQEVEERIGKVNVTTKLDLQNQVNGLQEKLEKMKERSYDGSDSGDELDWEGVEKEIEEVEEVRKMIENGPVESDSPAYEKENFHMEEDSVVLEIRDKFETSQNNLKNMLSNYNTALKDKKQLMAKFAEDRKRHNKLKAEYETKLRELDAQMKDTEKEKDALSKKIKQLEEKVAGSIHEDDESEIKRLRKAVRTKDIRLRELKLQTQRVKQEIEQKKKFRWEEKEKKLSREIDAMKRQKVVYQKQLEENSRKYREEMKKRSREIAQLKKQKVTLEKEKTRVELRSKKDTSVLKIKSKELVATQRRLREAQKVVVSSKREEKKKAVLNRALQQHIKERQKMKDDIKNYQRLLREKERIIRRMEKVNRKMTSKKQTVVNSPSIEEAGAALAIRDIVKEQQFENLLLKLEVEMQLKDEQLAEMKAKLNSIDTRDNSTQSVDMCAEEKINLLQLENRSLKAQLAAAYENRLRRTSSAHSTGMYESRRKTFGGKLTSEHDPVDERTLAALETTVQDMQFARENCSPSIRLKKTAEPRKWEDCEVFDRLTNVEHFTGIHKNRYWAKKRLKDSSANFSTPTFEPRLSRKQLKQNNSEYFVRRLMRGGKRNSFNKPNM